MLAAAGTIVLATTGLLALSLSILRGSLLELASKKATLPKQPRLLPQISLEDEPLFVDERI